jgi:hypothetical protein
MLKQWYGVPFGLSPVHPQGGKLEGSRAGSAYMSVVLEVCRDPSNIIISHGAVAVGGRW